MMHGDNRMTLLAPEMNLGDRSVGEIVSGIESVLSGNRAQFRSEYLRATPRNRLWFEMTVEPLRRAAGGAVISHLNITDRKNAEEASRSLAHASRLAVVGEFTASIANAMEAMADTPEVARCLMIRTGRNADQGVEVSITDTVEGFLRTDYPGSLKHSSRQRKMAWGSVSPSRVL